ncbi:MAG: hypothetical protein RLZZ265_304 [Verrucomicrobiota bacterium]|jgi:hypothetical protein
MRRGQRILLLGSLGGNLLLLLALLSSHHRSARIQAELAGSQREQSRQMAILSELESAAKSQPASKPSLLDSELVELARLRNEVTRLRGEQRAAAPTNSPSVRRSPVPAPTPVPAAPPVTKLTSTVTAQVPLGHALAIGGWTGAEPGQRIVGFITPATDANAPGQVLLQTHLVTIPDRLLERLGLQDLRTGENSSQAAAGLDSARLAALLKLADQTAGVSVLSAPRVLTGNGQVAQISLRQSQPDGTEFGPAISLNPTLDATGSSVRLEVGVELNLAPAKQP